VTTETVQSEWVNPERYLGPRMKRITFQCDRCGHTWVRTLRVAPKRNPPCPSRRCEEVARLAELERENENLRRMLEEGRGPATIGASARVRAVDETARIVMEDNRLTDLRGSQREGDIVAPSLPQAQQQMADAMFAPRKTSGVVPVIDAGGGPRRAIPAARLQAIGQRAIAGAYRLASVKPTAVLPREKPPSLQLRNARYDPSRPTAERSEK
jgi:hypothetical protein